jgi:hypothetical protein
MSVSLPSIPHTGGYQEEGGSAYVYSKRGAIPPLPPPIIIYYGKTVCTLDPISKEQGRQQKGIKKNHPGV